MDVYDLILERGIIGAIAYANKIDRTNYRLASKIDYATQDLIKIAQFQPMQFIQPASPSQFSQSPTTQNQNSVISPELIGPEKKLTDEDLVRIFGPDIPTSNKWGLLDSALNCIKIAAELKLSQAATTEIVKKYNFKKIDYLLNQLLDPKISQVVKSGLSEELSTLIHNAPGPIQSPFLNRPPLDVKGDLLRRIRTLYQYPSNTPDVARNLDDVIKGVLDKTAADSKGLHSILKQNNVYTNQFNSLIQQGKISASDLNGKTLQELDDILAKNSGNSPVLTSKDPSFLKKINTKLVIDDVVKESKISQQNWIGKLLTSASEKFPILGKILPWVGKIAGPLFVALSAKNLIEDYIKLKGKVDGRWWCEFAAAVLSILSFIPPLTPFALPLSMILGLGCGFVFKRDEEPNPSSLKPSDYRERMKSITREQLSQKDAGMIDRLFNEFSSDKKLLQQSFDQNKSKFDNALDSGAYLMKRYKEIGGSSSTQQVPANIESLRRSLTPEQFNLVKSTIPAMA